MKTLGLSYKEVCWGMPWALILRMLADLPYTKYLTEEESKQANDKPLTAETADDFMQFINKANSR